jgi:hypothetical protein
MDASTWNIIQPLLDNLADDVKCSDLCMVAYISLVLVVLTVMLLKKRNRRACRIFKAFMGPDDVDKDE